MQTPATTALDAAGVAYRVTEYDVDQTAHGYGEHVVTSLDLDPDTVGKSLVVTLDGERHVVAVVPVSSSLDLKALASVAGAKRAAMTDASTAERLTGSVLGGIAPFGHRRPMPVYVDELLAAAEEMHVSGGRRGLELSLAPDDLIVVTAATVADLRA